MNEKMKHSVQSPRTAGGISTVVGPTITAAGTNN